MNKKMQNYKEDYSNFDALKLTLASPEQILRWSYGEVHKPETINYRTFKPEPDGLFCEKIFGPTKNYECYCGKYKKIRYKGIVCDKCGVEVTRKDVRRERLGHIDLVVPVAHVWFAYGVPNKLSLILNMSHKKILSVLYYTRYMVVSVEEENRDNMLQRVRTLREKEKKELYDDMAEELKAKEAEFDAKIKELKADKKSQKNKKTLQFKENQLNHERKQAMALIRRDFAEMEEELDIAFTKFENLVQQIEVGTILTEDDYVDLTDRDLLFFEAQMGAEAIEKLLSMIDLDEEIKTLKRNLKNEKGIKKANTIKRLQYFEGFKANNLDPTWMIISVLPVVPPELRPIVSLPGGRFAVSDLNDLYRSIVIKNNRLRRLIEIGAPDVILRNEKRMLQESVDALIDNQHRPGKALLNSRRLPYQSLTDQLRGKKGMLRKNLLGKRVDYSGRAVIVGDATLTLNQCGIPKSVALEMFKPFVIHEILEAGLVVNIRAAKDMIDEQEDIVWDLLEKIVYNRPILLNRPPTLHKYSIQAFYPRLVEGDAIRLHPLVCKAFNADFDGDAMQVHVLLSDEAMQEGSEKMLASKNIMDIKDGKMLAFPTKDMVLGFFLMTELKKKENPKIFGDFNEAIRAYNRGDITISEEIITRGKGEILYTSVGRVILNSTFPDDYPFFNEQVGGTKIKKILEDVKNKYPFEILPDLLDELKRLGFKYATDLGFSFAMEDCNLDLGLEKRIAQTEEKDMELEENYLQGFITQKEKEKLSTNEWHNFAEKLQDEAWEKISKENPVYQMVESGANGAQIQARQILTIKGMVMDSSGNWVALPIKGNYRDGLSAFEYFVAANGGRKGIADRSIKTSDSGYLTRQLVDVAHDVIIRMDDCGYEGEGITLKREDERKMTFGERVRGRFLTKDVVNKKGKVLVKANQYVTVELSGEIEDAETNQVFVRSPINCKAPLGICKKCYGYNNEINEEIEMGRAVGVIAAQSIGEPGTQMTMQTFHKGGVQRTDITQGLPKLIELFQARAPKVEAQISSIDGTVKVEIAEDDSKTLFIEGTKKVVRNFIISDVKKVSVKDGEKVKASQLLFISEEEEEKQAPFSGVVKVDSGIMTLEGEMKAEEKVKVLPGLDVLVNDGDKVYTGQQLSEGGVDPKKLASVAGIQKAQEYVLNHAQKVFAEQGVGLMDVHIEIITRQMARLGGVMESGDSEYLVGTIVNRFRAEYANECLRKENKNIALVVPKFMGIRTSASQTESILSAMSFENLVRVVTNFAIIGQVDYLRGMKENVMIGRKIPTGDEARIETICEFKDY